MHTFIGSGTKMGVYNNREYIANKRDQIIFGEPYNKNKYPGGCRSFDELTLDQIEKLDNLGILNLDECQNEAPSVGEMIDFLRSIDSTGGMSTDTASVRNVLISELVLRALGKRQVQQETI